jgi:hypothetical protein
MFTTVTPFDQNATLLQIGRDLDLAQETVDAQDGAEPGLTDRRTA